MKRVRIVAITAVALGAAVTAGTQLQISRAAAPDQQVVSASQVATAATGLPTENPPAETQSATWAASAPQTELAQTAPAVAARSGAPSLIASVTQDRAAERPAAPIAVAPAVPGLGITPEAAPEAGRALVRASVLPGIDLGGTDRGAAGPGPTEGALHRLAERAAEPVPAAAETPPEAVDPVLQAELDACAIWLVVTPAPGAMLDASVYAPCDGGSAVTLSHAGLSFDTRLADDGQLMVQIPALTEEAGVALSLADGRVQEDETIVPDLATMERVVLQWQGPALLLLHAYEFGAAYGDAGHVHAGAPRHAGLAGQGFVTVLGDPSVDAAQRAQVYSYPRGETLREGRVTLEIEAPITDASCGRSLTATSIEVHGSTSAQVRQIRVDMPECDGNGGFVVLPGVLPELLVALN